MVFFGDGFLNSKGNKGIIKIIESENITLAHFTFRDGRYNGMHFESTGANNYRLYNLLGFNIGERYVKVSKARTPDKRNKNMIVEYCRFEQTKDIPHDREGCGFKKRKDKDKSDKKTEFLFPSVRRGRAITPTAVNHALRKNLDVIGVENLTPHDLRRTAASHMTELGTPGTLANSAAATDVSTSPDRLVAPYR